MNDQAPKPQLPLGILAFEMVGFLIGMYFFMGADGPETLANIGLPASPVQGVAAYVVGIICLTTGATPLIHWAIAQKKKP